MEAREFLEMLKKATDNVSEELETLNSRLAEIPLAIDWVRSLQLHGMQIAGLSMEEAIKELIEAGKTKVTMPEIKRLAKRFIPDLVKELEIMAVNVADLGATFASLVRYAETGIDMTLLYPGLLPKIRRVVSRFRVTSGDPREISDKMLRTVLDAIATFAEYFVDNINIMLSEYAKYR